MNKRHVSSAWVSLVLVMLLLFVAVSPIFGQEPPGTFTNTIVEGTLPAGAEGQLDTLIYQALKTMEPNLAGYTIRAETRVLGYEGNVLTCETTATLRSLTSRQAFLFRLVGAYSLASDTWTVVEADHNYVPKVEAPKGEMPAEEVEAILANKQKAAEELAKVVEALPVEEDATGETAVGALPEDVEPTGVSNAKMVAFAPIYGYGPDQDPRAGWVVDRVGGKFRAGGWLSDIYKSPAATEPRAWDYLSNGSILFTWFSVSHGITARLDGAPCFGLVYDGGDMMFNEFIGMRRWVGLMQNVALVDACNSYMEPLRSSIWARHSMKTYIGGVRLMPFPAADYADERFWKYTLTDGRTMSSALSQAMSDFGLSGYYALQGYSGTYGPRPLRIQLTWGSSPRDLDEHLWLPTSNRYHVYYAARGSTTDHPYAQLDRDDMDGYGPENITPVEAYTGSYRFAVYNWSNERALAGSGATVRLYRGSSLIRTYTVPSYGSGRWWVVFDYSGSDGTITTRNYLTSIYPGPYTSSLLSPDAEMPAKDKVLVPAEVPEPEPSSK